ncbi:MAG: sugar ABC transporter substrate-binding protein [Devosia sp.]
MKLFKSLALAGLATLGLSLAMPVTAQAQDWLEGTPKKPISDLKIGFSFRGGAGGNLYVAQYVAQLHKMADELGIELVIVDAEDDPGRQTQQLPELIAQQPDAIVVWALSAAGIVPALKQASDAGIPVVTVVADVDPSGQQYVKAHAGPNDTLQGTQAAQALIDAMGGKGNVVQIMGTAGFAPAEMRAQAFRDVAAKYPDIKLLDTQVGTWSVGTGQSLMENFITRFGKDIDGVITSDGYTGTGAYLAVEAAEKAGTLEPGHVKFADPNAVGTSYDLVKDGKYSATVLQLPEADAEFSFKIAIRVAAGIEVPRYSYLQTPVATPQNYADYPRPGL